MSWSLKSAGNSLVATEVVTLASSATYAFTSEIDFIDLDKNNNQYIGFTCTASAVTGTNVDVSLHSYPESGTAGAATNLTLDALVADVTNAAKIKQAVVDIKPYFMGLGRIGLLCDANESANTMTVVITVPQTK